MDVESLRGRRHYDLRGSRGCDVVKKKRQGKSMDVGGGRHLMYI